MSLVKTRKVGGSLVVTLPKKAGRKQKNQGRRNPRNNPKKVRKDGFSVLKGMKPFTAKDELTTHD